MNTKPNAPISRLVGNLTYLGLILALLISGSLIGASGTAQASSHREAPLISQDPVADNTDLYAFVSPDRPDSVTIIGSWIPGELPQGGPYYYRFGDDVAYDLNIDNIGDAKAHITYRFMFKTTTANQGTFLYNTGPLKTINDKNLNMQQTYTVEEIINGKSTKLAENLPVPPAFNGPKSVPDYGPLFKAGIQSIS